MELDEDRPDISSSRHRFGPYTVETSRENKLLFPDTGISKGELIDYYQRAADRMLPHLKDRPLVLQRFPDGIRGKGFYQKQVSDHFPEWITTVSIDLVGRERAQTLTVCDKKAALAYLADQACITFHPWLSRTGDVDNPDSLIIDVDPPGEAFDSARLAALRARDLLEELGLPCFPKLTGSTGLHLLVPLDRSQDFDTTRAFAREAMELLVSRYPDELTTEQRKRKRRGRVYLDTGRNAYGQTAVAPWSVRPLPGAPVAVPLAWSDLARSGIGPRDFNVRNVFRKTARRHDPWAGLRRRARSIARARKRLERLRGSRSG